MIRLYAQCDGMDGECQRRTATADGFDVPFGDAAMLAAAKIIADNPDWQFSGSHLCPQCKPPRPEG